MSWAPSTPESRLKDYKMRACRAAKQLGYTERNPLLLDRINAAKSELEVTRIMATERNREEE